jgi:aminocarboxymuconate-semialdehyde decarboxylase
LPLGDPDAAMREIERAVGELGARGIQLFSNINGKPLDTPEHLALFDRMAAFDLPVWLHPYRGAAMSDYASETTSKFEIWWTFGWPYETSVAMARLVFSGIFDRHPHLKVITHHLGAMAPYFEGRVGPRLGSAWHAHLGRRLHQRAEGTAEAADRLLPHVLRRYRRVRRV